MHGGPLPLPHFGTFPKQAQSIVEKHLHGTKRFIQDELNDSQNAVHFREQFILAKPIRSAFSE